MFCVTGSEKSAPWGETAPIIVTDPSVIADNVSVNGYPSAFKSAPTLTVSGNKATFAGTITNWQDPVGTYVEHPFSIPVTLSGNPGPVSPDTLTQSDSTIAQEAQKGTTEQEVKDNYINMMKAEMWSMVYKNCSLSQKAELDKPGVKDALLSTIVITPTVEKNGDKFQITSSTINLEALNAELGKLGVKGFTTNTLDYSNPLPPAEDVLAWWAILLIVVGSLLIIGLIITLILYKKKNKGYKGSYAY